MAHGYMRIDHGTYDSWLSQGRPGHMAHGYLREDQGTWLDQGRSGAWLMARSRDMVHD